LDVINNCSFAIPGITPDLDSSGTRTASHVCQKWRHIALAAPSLWTIIREDDDESAALCFMHRPLFMPLDLSCAIYVDYSGSSK